ncbi:DUF2279 domain-containing protein [Flavobacterium psychrophilum]|uniref:DUF2279 domain-containing protein n=1 Tax=Flavobacterium psychrophilum TaxID=96345 RepID=UPI000B7C2FE9|nr:DUF2279 domain-containing protein [Flavobacterium psychrophilum]EKT3962571.1 DUF2279 domain-containing protein [Flavobacterium psychrophilum]EKT4516084.1 DUF2279 domain-containing protein [Flavobacterium psychrophilum]MCB6098809.1 YfiM family protein [Flavobacterium psychrophilum]SNA81355.1 conserved hypothetical protein [Flavobacterium psychrophilum]
MKLYPNKYLSLLFLSTSIFAQKSIDDFLKPVDSLLISRRNTIVITEAVAISGAVIGLNELWYKDYPKSNFHFINDNKEWLQMDKLGHLYSAYHIGNAGANLLQWSGATKQQQLLYGSTLGFVFLTAVEVLDGYSQEWGASPGDIIANATGTGLYVSQELLWKEQRIVPKFSFHTTSYAPLRPNTLGKSINEQVLKDYNGQTYWLSANVHSFFPNSKISKWLNVAVGYGAEGMISGNKGISDLNSSFEDKRHRQFYLSLDADLTKIKTKSHFLKTIFSILNTIKIPAPSVELTSNGNFSFHYLYF